ncbi:MAG: metallophosphoesterase family protein [Lactobacillaceae bacterium]|nr:metallophosphoesterase family protein [Lactobacillaceae bacterium]
MKYFTADLHFGHPMVAAFRGFIKDEILMEKFERDVEVFGYAQAQQNLTDYAQEEHISFKKIGDVDAHNAKIVENINQSVGADDELYVLGDVSKKITKESMRAWVFKIACKNRYLSKGNHDSNAEEEYLPVFNTVKESDEIQIRDIKLLLAHYPYEDSRAPVNTGEWLLCGHTHTREKYNLNQPK